MRHIMLRYRNPVFMLAAVLFAAVCPHTEAVQRTKGIASALQNAMTGAEREGTKEEASDKFVNPFATWLQAFDWNGAPGSVPANASGFLTSANQSDIEQLEAEKDVPAEASAPNDERVSALQAGAGGEASSAAKAVAEKLAADQTAVANLVAQQAEEQKALADEASNERATADAAAEQRQAAEDAIAEKVMVEQDAAKEAASARIATIDTERGEAEKAWAEQAAQDTRERTARETLDAERAAVERVEQEKANAENEAAAAAAAEKEAEEKAAVEKQIADRYAAEREADLKEVANQVADRYVAETDADLKEVVDNQAVAGGEASEKNAAEKEAADKEAVGKISADQEATETEVAEKAAAEKEAAKREAAEREVAAAKEGMEKEASENEAATKEAAEKEAVANEAAEKEAADKKAAENEAAEREVAEKGAAEKEASENEAAEQKSVEKEAAEKEAAAKEAAEQEAATKDAAERQTAEENVGKEAVEKEASEKEATEKDAAAKELAKAREASVKEDTGAAAETAAASQQGETSTEARAGNESMGTADVQRQELSSSDSATSKAKPVEAQVQTPLADFEQFEQSLDQEVFDADLKPDMSLEQTEKRRSSMAETDVLGHIPSAVKVFGQNLRDAVAGADIREAGAELRDAAAGIGRSAMVRVKTDEEDVERGPMWDEATDRTAKKARRKRAVPLSELGKRISDAAWKQNITESVSYNKTSRTCSVGTPGCKSVCRWLKLTDRDFDSAEVPEGSCPLFDWSMESAGYMAPRLRSSDGKGEPVDCVSELLGQNVFNDDVENYVYQLEECMVGLPQTDSERYGVSMEVVAGEVQDWKDERRERAEAAEVEADLRHAVARGRQAFTYKEGEAEATEQIRAAMQRAERIDGHYLIDDVRSARELLDKLQPLVDVREQLSRGMVRARQALDTKAPSALLGALVWLNVSIGSGDKLGLDEPVAEAMEARSNLLEVQEVFWRLHDAMFKANVSAHTKLHVTAAIEGLSDAMKRARAVNLTSPLQGGKALLQELGDVRESQQALRNAVYHGEATLTAMQPESDAPPAAFSKDLELLNHSLERAAYLGLPSRDTAPAVSTVARIREATSAKQALLDATRKGHKLLVASEGAALELYDAQENDAMAELGEAITWAEHARLEQGVPAARELLRFLNQVRETKGRMLAALAQGNTSLNASYEEEPAIDALTAALKEERRLNLSSGVDQAREMVVQLKRIRDARSALGAAMVSANRTLHLAGIVPAEAAEHLNESIQEAERMNLGAEASLARQQLERLVALRNARDDLQGSLEMNRLLQSKERDQADDEQSVDLLKERRAGFRVAQLPKLASWSDDGDKDFEEHISRLNHSILVARGYGLVDPEMLEQLESLRRLQRAWEALNRTKNEGLEALQSRKDLYKTAVRLEAALERAQASGLSVGLSASRKVLQDLQELPKARDHLDSAMLMANASLQHKGDLQEALRELNGAMRRAEPFGLRRHMKQAAEFRDQLMAMSQAWFKLRTAMVQGAVALRSRRLDDVALRTLQVAVDEAEARDLREETAPARELLLELASLHAQLHSLDEAVFTRKISKATDSDDI